MNRKTVWLLVVAVATTGVYLATAGGTPDETVTSSPSIGAPERERSAATRSAVTPLPATRATTVPAADPPRIVTAAPLPANFHVLLKRNLFLGGTTKPSPYLNRSGRSALPEDQFVLRGILHQSGKYTALIEDLATRTVRSLVAGDPVARGTLREVSFDGLEYQADGEPTQVEIGEKLTGDAMADPIVPPRQKTKEAGRDQAQEKNSDKDKNRESERNERKN